MDKEKKYIDLHTHILPGIDDGANTVAEALEMIKKADSQGIGVIVFTPHCGYRNQSFSVEKTKKVFDDLVTSARELCPEMRFYLGNELYYGESTVTDLAEGRILTLATSSYILIEFAVGESYTRMYNGLRTLLEAGYNPILAHAERYQVLYKDINKIQELIRLGIYIQINSKSFLGGPLDGITAWCNKLLKKELVHFIASDCHDTEYRKPVMEEAICKILKKIDRETIEKITVTNPIKVLTNQFI